MNLCSYSCCYYVMSSVIEIFLVEEVPFIYIYSLLQYILTIFSFPSTPQSSSASLPFPPDLLFFYFPSEKTRPLVDINRPQHNKMQKDLTQALISMLASSDLLERKGSKSRQQSQRHAQPHCLESHKIPKLNNHIIYVEDLI